MQLLGAMGSEPVESVGADHQGLSTIPRLPEKRHFINIHSKEVSKAFLLI